ncbi:hypothetical protein Tco_0630747 [Tanacetum coccineum]
MYLTVSRLDIQFSTYLCARYQANLKESHLIIVKRIFRYLKSTPSLGLWYLKCSSFDLKGYSNSDYVGCNMDKKSTSSACQLLGGKLVCWSAKKQQSVAMLSAKAEYVAATRFCAKILYMKSQLTNYGIIYEKVPIFYDNTSAIAISNNPVLNSRTKHIDIRYHYIKDHILKGDIELHFIPTQYQLVVIFTKPLDEPTFKRLIVELVMDLHEHLWLCRLRWKIDDDKDCTNLFSITLLRIPFIFDDEELESSLEVLVDDYREDDLTVIICFFLHY